MSFIKRFPVTLYHSLANQSILAINASPALHSLPHSMISFVNEMMSQVDIFLCVLGDEAFTTHQYFLAWFFYHTRELQVFHNMIYYS